MSRLLHYVVAGVIAGYGYGAFGLFQTVDPTAQDLKFWLVLAPIIGAVMGMELFHTRSWGRYGRRGWYGRWALAGASGFGAAGSLLFFAGEIPRWGVWGLTAFGLIAGVCFGIEARPSSAAEQK